MQLELGFKFPARLQFVTSMVSQGKNLGSGSSSSLGLEVRKKISLQCVPCLLEVG